jgi:hypothetical protein
MRKMAVVEAAEHAKMVVGGVAEAEADASENKDGGGGC